MTATVDAAAVRRDETFELGAETRFPLRLAPDNAAIWECYEQSLDARWDPEQLDDRLDDLPSASPGVRSAAALVWSHRAWCEYTGIAEAEAVLVRLCLDPTVAIDVKYCLSLRAVERARSTDACAALARRLDRYRPDPGASVESLLNADLVRRALHTGVDADAYFVSHLYVQSLIDAHLWDQVAADAGGGIAVVARHIAADKHRQVTWAWAFVEERARTFDASLVADNVNAVLAEEELKGRRVVDLLEPSAEREELVGAQRLAAGAGLGVVGPDVERDTTRQAIAQAAANLAPLGVRVVAHVS